MDHGPTKTLKNKKIKINTSIKFVTGERALRAILEEALKIAERCVNPDDRDAIVKMVGDITSMTDALCELRSAGKVGISQ